MNHHTETEGFICKLFYWEEYETPVGRMQSIKYGENTPEQWRYKYEKAKNYFKDRQFSGEREANEWGQEQMYYDPECHYEVVKVTPNTEERE